MVDLTTANYGWTKPTVGADSDTWGGILNTDLDSIDATVKGVDDHKVPSGGIIMWSGSIVSVPAGWHLCDGTAGTPDLRGRMIIGAGGAYAVAATGGAATYSGSTDGHTLTTAEIPAHNHGVNDPTHIHGLTDPTHVHAINAHATGLTVNDPTHVHGAPGGDIFATNNGSGVNGFSNGGNYVGNHDIYNTTAAAATGISLTDPTHIHTMNAAATGITMSAVATGITIQNNGGGGAHVHTLTNIPTLPPYYALAFIMKT